METIRRSRFFLKRNITETPFLLKYSTISLWCSINPCNCNYPSSQITTLFSFHMRDTKNDDHSLSYEYIKIWLHPINILIDGFNSLH